jgi:hypothetical protein
MGPRQSYVLKRVPLPLGDLFLGSAFKADLKVWQGI